jgi:hypothetical protein
MPNTKTLLEKDCSFSTLQKLQKHFLNSGQIITNLDEYQGLDNKFFGDAKLELLDQDKNWSTLNIDFKKQERDRQYIQIELVQVDAKGQYSSWLYNNNIDYICQEFKNGEVYLIKHKTLISLSKNYVSRDNVWDTCLVYNRNKDIYKEEHEWIIGQLSNYEDTRPLTIRNGIIGENDIHINGCFNFPYGQRRHSGFCLNIPLTYMERYKI